MNVLRAKQNYEIKNIAATSGENEKLYEARLVARGYSQIKETEFVETFAPDISFPTLRLLLSLVVEENRELPKRT